MVVLDVPYFVQPTPNTCQSTCLKMFAAYLAKSQAVSHAGAHASIESIWREINTGTARPEQQRNSYRNMKWWLEKEFPRQTFAISTITDPTEGSAKLIGLVDRGYPAMVSTNHSRTLGHIVLVVGYDRGPSAQSGALRFICHDPYGRFDPQLLSKDYGRNRFRGGQSLAGGGEVGPGKGVLYDYEGVRRSRTDRHSAGTLYVISVA